MARSVSNPSKVSKPRLGENPTWWSLLVGIQCPSGGRPQSPRKMGSTNPRRGYNHTDFHMCGDCGKLLDLTGERRYRRFFLLGVPVFFGVASVGSSLLRRIDGLNKYHEVKEVYEPNFLGFLLKCVAFYVGLSLLSRFEIVGVATLLEEDNEQAVSNS